MTMSSLPPTTISKYALERVMGSIAAHAAWIDERGFLKPGVSMNADGYKPCSKLVETLNIAPRVEVPEHLKNRSVQRLWMIYGLLFVHSGTARGVDLLPSSADLATPFSIERILFYMRGTDLVHDDYDLEKILKALHELLCIVSLGEIPVKELWQYRSPVYPT